MDGFFNCIVSKGDTFFDFFINAFTCSFWYHSPFWILVFVSFFISKRFSTLFHRKIVAYSLIIFTPIILISTSLIAIYLGHKPSDYLLHSTLFIMPLSALSMVLIIKSTIHKNKSRKKILSNRFQSLSIINQIVFLVLLFLLLFGFSMLYSIVSWRYYYFIFILITTFIYGYFLYVKMKNITERKVPYKGSDFIPIYIIIGVFVILSTITIGEFICAIPNLNCYFSCANCK